VSELRGLLSDAARMAFDELREAHPSEVFYAFALEVADGTAMVSASANTEGGLRRVAERFAAEGYGQAERLASDEPGSLRWRTSDWVHKSVGAGHFEAANALIAETVDPEDSGAVVKALVGACRDLNREDFFGWGPERDGVVVLITTSDPADLLEHARDVNPAVPFARLQAALGV
jgi:hypothetical protein